jgi:Galactose oxidase, central domain
MEANALLPAIACEGRRKYEGERISMMPARKSLGLACVILTALFVASCSGVPGGNSGSGGTGTTFIIKAAVTGLSGSGLVLQNNGKDNLAISSNGTFSFKTHVTGYAVTVFTQPSNPTQTCVVANGTGTATTTVTVQVSCGVGTWTIGGQVTGMTGSGLVLQDNGGDNLTVNQNGTFAFATQLTTGATYSVTVLTQPTNPTQTCLISAGGGTVSGNVGTVVVTCSVGTLKIGGSVSGLAGTGLILQNNGADNLKITANGNFTFPTLLPAGAPYSVTVQTQPSGPAQDCKVNNASSTTGSTDITSIQVVCPAVFFPIGGKVVGLYVPQGATSQLVLQDNGGDNLPLNGNGPFTFVTQIAYQSTYDVSVFVDAGTQPQGVVLWNWQGTALAPVNNVEIDYGHNDWTWMAGASTANQLGKSTTPVPPRPTVDTDTPGGSKYPATWTDNSGNLWLFSGYGYSHDSTIPNQPSMFNEMWAYQGTGNYFAGYDNYWMMVSPVANNSAPPARWGAVSWTDTATNTLYLFGGQSGLLFMNDLWTAAPHTATDPRKTPWTVTWTQVSAGTFGNGIYSGANSVPGARWGATTRTDGSGNVWLFGGFGYDDTSATPGLLNDLWKFNIATKTWTFVNGSTAANADGNYGTQGTPNAANASGPGGRQASVSWFDASGNFWLFGGYNLSATGQPNAFNDLWEFNTTTNQWTWVSGASVVNQTAVYGQLGVADPGNVPGARWSPAAWSDVDANGNLRLWLFGGQGYDATGNGSLGDLWVYTKGEWIWVKGPNSVSQKGLFGVAPNPVVWPHYTDAPGSRWGAAYWTDPYGQFWMFGGEGFDSAGTNGNGLLQDLERYLPYPVLQ